MSFALKLMPFALIAALACAKERQPDPQEASGESPEQAVESQGNMGTPGAADSPTAAAPTTAAPTAAKSAGASPAAAAPDLSGKSSGDEGATPESGGRRSTDESAPPATPVADPKAELAECVAECVAGRQAEASAPEIIESTCKKSCTDQLVQACVDLSKGAPQAEKEADCRKLYQ